MIAYLQDKLVAPRIEKLLENAGKEERRLFLSMINLEEIRYINITERRGGVAKAQDALALVQQLPI